MGGPQKAGGSWERAPRRSRTPAILTIDWPIDRAQIPGLCRRVHGLAAGGEPALVLCDVGGVREADVVTVDALARMQLVAKRLGGRIRLQGASPALQDLLCLMGLSDVLPLCGDLRLEASGDAEERE